MVFWHFVMLFVLSAKTKTFSELFILRMFSLNSRWNESFTCLNFNVTMPDKSFLKGIRLEQGGGHFFYLKPKVSLISLSHFY